MTLPVTPSLLTRVDGGVLHVSINRPEARNAMNEQVLTDLIAVFGSLASRDDLRVVILRGTGGNFCAGGDIKDFARIRQIVAEPGTDPVAGFNRRGGEMLELIDTVPQATIAVVEGAVLGGGFGLACVADVTIAHQDAGFGLPETGLGVLPAQIAPFVVRRIGLAQARRLGVCGARFDGAEAVRLGLAHFVEADGAALEARLADVLKQILRCAPRANAETKRIMLAVGGQPLAQVLDDAAIRFSAALRGPEAAEGTRAFIEKRPPGWATDRAQGKP
jgi:isohexenylglutaconyl-CoA hydratase